MPTHLADSSPPPDLDGFDDDWEETMEPTGIIVDELLTTRSAATRDLATRGMSLRVESVDDKQRSVEAVFATEEPVTVYDWTTYDLIDEVLRMDGAEIPGQVPLLDNHSRYSLDNVLGSGREIAVAGGVVRGRVFFADGDDIAERAWKKARAGHLTDVSVGYRVLESVTIPAGQTQLIAGRSYTAAAQRALRIATKWQLREVSLVPIGADSQAKIREAAAASLTHSPLAPDAGAHSSKGATMPAALRQYLATLGLRSDADDATAWQFFHALTGAQRTQADTLRGSVAPPPAVEPKPESARTAPPTVTPPAEPTAEQIRAAERQRIARITELGGTDVSPEIIQRAIAEGWDEARFAPVALQAVRDARRGTGAPAIHSRSHDGDCTAAALTAALLCRQGVALDHRAFTDPRAFALRGMPDFLRANVNADARQRAMEQGHRFAAMSLVDICAEAVRIDGGRVTHDREEMFRSAVSSGTLTAIFSNVVNAEMLAGYIDTPDTTTGWCGETDVPDFRASERAGMGKFGPLKKHARGGTAEALDISDSKESSKIARYSGIFSVDEMDIIDDRFGALESVSPKEMGQIAAALRPDLAYSILLANASLDADGVALFHADHSNTAALAFSAANLEAVIAKMSKQRIRGRAINIAPRYLLVPQDLRFGANIVLTSAQRFDGSSTGTAGGVKNPLAELGIQLVADDRLGVAGCVDPVTGVSYAGSATIWFVSARAGENGAKTIVIKYRRGTGRVPSVRSFVLDKGSFGIGWDVKHDIGADADDYRALSRGNS